MLAELPARADHTGPWDVFSASLTVGLHVGESGPNVSVGLRASWTNTMPAMPMGADLEARYIIDRGVFRVLPAFHVMPSSPSTGSACHRQVAARGRVKVVSLGVAGMLEAGPVIELGDGFDWGGWFGGSMSGAFFGGYLRGLYFAERELEGEIGLGFDVPNRWGFSNVGVFCDGPFSQAPSME